MGTVLAAVAFLFLAPGEIRQNPFPMVVEARAAAVERDRRTRQPRSAKVSRKSSKVSRTRARPTRSMRRSAARSRRVRAPRWERLADTLLTPGVRYQEYRLEGAVVQRLHVVRVDTRQPSLEVMLIPSQPGRQETLSDIVQRYDSLNPVREVVAAVNGYFWSRGGSPVGITASEGEVLQLRRYKRWSAIVTDGAGRFLLDTFLLSLWVRLPDNSRIPLSAVNSREGQQGMVLYTRAAGDTIPRLFPSLVNMPDEENPDSFVVVTIPADTVECRLWKLRLRYLREPYLNGSVPCQVIGVDSGVAVVPLRGCLLSLGSDVVWRPGIGDTVWLESRLSPSVPFPVRHIWSGTPQLVRNGRVRLTAELEGTVSRRFLHRRRSRTALGQTRQGELLLVVVEQNATSAGATVAELARIMQRLGAYRALNLDGGSSSGMYMRGGTVHGNHHPVASALAVVQRRLRSVQ
ncbi:hypothetical protein HRbin21_01080 [bacterium HR21]|nr:hypothetical protein HRbin21_01080 [bacterium HR21]